LNKPTGQRGFRWPKNARIAVVMTCLLENWSEGKGPPFSVQTTSLRPGTHDRAAMTWGTYGGRAGVWRLLKILDANQIPSTFVANARALELNPAAAVQIVKSGHEIAGHSYAQDDLLAYLNPEEEKEIIQRCVRIITEISGERPKGWLSPVLASTERTEGILADEGFLWYGDYNHVDLPFVVPVGQKSIVALPHSDFADHRVLRQNPRDWFDVYKDTFDYLYENEPTSYLNITVHCHFGGRPLIATHVDKILKYIRGFADVWIVRHDELAQWVLDNQIHEWSNQDRFFPASAPA
jgi:peptidoglycan/xylan/chitin deacetylase (PgdA/CDA1 family)